MAGWLGVADGSYSERGLLCALWVVRGIGAILRHAVDVPSRAPRDTAWTAPEPWRRDVASVHEESDSVEHRRRGQYRGRIRRRLAGARDTAPVGCGWREGPRRAKR